MLPKLYMVFDVESIGLHGEGFAVAYVVIDGDGRTHDERVFACDPNIADGVSKDREWVAANVPALEETHGYPLGVRAAFWRQWMIWKERGAILVADCAWPVEARFLADCVDDKMSERKWEGPYPLHDLASIILATGGDPLATNERLPKELPAHHPLMDARQSARLLVQAMKSPNAEVTGQPEAGPVD